MIAEDNRGLRPRLKDEVPYLVHAHKVVLADGLSYDTFDSDDVIFDELIYMSMNCTVCGERVLVSSPISAKVKKLKERVVESVRQKRWVTLLDYDLDYDFHT